MRTIAVVLAAALGALALAALSSAGTRSMMGVTAKLTASEEVPKQVVKDAKAHGQFTGRLEGRKLTWTLTFAGLTGPALQAHIHLGAMGKSGNVLVALCAPCKSGVKGTATLPASALKALAKHLLYVNVHTKKNPAGEIRGQLAEH